MPSGSWPVRRSRASPSRHLQHPVAARGAFGARHLVQAGEERDVFLDGEIGVQREQLRHVADVALDRLWLACDVKAATRAAPPDDPAAGQHLDVVVLPAPFGRGSRRSAGSDFKRTWSTATNLPKTR